LERGGLIPGNKEKDEKMKRKPPDRKKKVTPLYIERGE